MINTCKILRVIAIRTYWAEQLIFWSKMRISAQYVRIVRIGHSYVLGSNNCETKVIASLHHYYTISYDDMGSGSSLNAMATFAVCISLT